MRPALPADLPVQRAGVRLAHRLLDVQHLHRYDALAEAQGNLVPHLHVVGGPGRLAVDGDQAVVTGLVGHSPPLDEAGYLKKFIESHGLSVYLIL